MHRWTGRQLLPAIKNHVDTMKKTILIPATLAILLCLAGNAFSIAVSPAVISAGYLQRGSAYEYESYITNPGPDPVTLKLDITPSSEYLKNHITITPKTLTIAPGKTETIKITLDIPNASTAVTNGTHTLAILPGIDTTATQGVKLVSTSLIELRFTIPGIVIDNVALESFNAPDAEIGQTIIFELYAKNTGNIRQSAFPFVEIYRYGIKIDTARGITEHIIEPSASSKMTIKYSTSSLQSGKYRATAYIEYSDSKKTNTLEDNFRLESRNEEDQPAQEDQSSKDTQTPTSQDPSDPGEEEDTISIGDTPDNQQTYPLDKQDPKTTDGDIQIRNLIAESKGKTVLITLELENTGTKDIDYDLELHIYDKFQKKIGTIITTGHIKGTETHLIKKSWDAPGNGNYTIEAQVTYSKYDGTFIKVAKEETSIEIKEDQNRLTGLFLQTSGASKITLVILLLAVLLILARQLKKRKRLHALESASKRYQAAESNLEKITKETGNLKKRIQHLKQQNTKKENRK